MSESTLMYFNVVQLFISVVFVQPEKRSCESEHKRLAKNYIAAVSSVWTTSDGALQTHRPIRPCPPPHSAIIHIVIGNWNVIRIVRFYDLIIGSGGITRTPPRT